MTCTLNLEGFLEKCDTERIEGWAWDKNKPNTPINVDIYDSDTFVAKISANIFRSDLLDVGKGNGRHGFIYIIPDKLKNQNPLFRVKFAGTNVDLTSKPPPALIELPIMDINAFKEKIELLDEIIETLSDIPSVLVELLEEKGVLKYEEWERKINSKIPRTSLALLKERQDSLIPPCRIVFVGDGDFNKIGEQFLQYFIELGGLKPSEKVLDVGCGIGRMAIPLTRYLNYNGKYEGFDIVSKGIDWCKKKITPKYPNFRFQLVDIFNKEYNPKGRFEASNYKFPYENESFDFVFLTSVFTHMLPQDMENYFSEITRVLRNNGRCLISFFLLNDESYKLIDMKKSTIDFKFVFQRYCTRNENSHEAGVAYEEQYIRSLYDKYRLKIKEPIHYGSWCGRQNFLDYQDIIIASKI